jgi:hypothetical protein
MKYSSKLTDMLRKSEAFNQLKEKMMLQMERSEMGQKLLDHHPIESKVEVQSYGMALKKS